jgi:hypothetical protein
VAGYDDGKVACTDDELIIRDYYFFAAGAKRILNCVKDLGQFLGLLIMQLLLRSGIR